MADYRAIDASAARPRLRFRPGLTTNDSQVSPNTKSVGISSARGRIADAIESYSQQTAFRAGTSAPRLDLRACRSGHALHLSADYVRAYQYSQDSLTIAEQFKGTKELIVFGPIEYGIDSTRQSRQCRSDEARLRKGAEYFQQSLKALEAIDLNRQKYAYKFIDDLWDIGQSYSDESDYLRALVYLDKSMAMATASHETGRARELLTVTAFLP
jgi:hypothetical protein